MELEMLDELLDRGEGLCVGGELVLVAMAIDLDVLHLAELDTERVVTLEYVEEK